MANEDHQSGLTHFVESNEMPQNVLMKEMLSNTEDHDSASCFLL